MRCVRQPIDSKAIVPKMPPLPVATGRTSHSVEVQQGVGTYSMVTVTQKCKMGKVATVHLSSRTAWYV